MENNLFTLLKNKSILQILNGDSSFGDIIAHGEERKIKISMPYLSGPTLCKISNKFGLPVTYGSLSRWQYLEDIIQHCIEHNRVSDLLSFLFSIEQFKEKLEGCSPSTILNTHKQIIYTVIERINGELLFGGNELVIINKRFTIHPIGSTITVETPSVQIIDRDYIRDLSERAMQDVSDGNFDSAITKSRTLLEEIFCYVIEQKKVEPSCNGNIGTLYKQVKDLYDMHGDKDTDKRINMLLSGLEKIVSSIAAMRNEGSDSHGLGAKRISIDEYHTRLFVNAAMAMGDFIISVSNNN